MEKTWVVVADSNKARFFEAESRVGPLQELTGMEPGAARTNGRQPAVNGSRQRAKPEKVAEQPVERTEHDAKFFAREIANRLDLEGQQGSFDRLVIAAAPQFLGHLRIYLSSLVRDRVANELAEDLVNLKSSDKVRRSLPPRL